MSLDILELVKIAFIEKRKHTRQQLLCFCKVSAYGENTVCERKKCGYGSKYC